MNIPDSDFKQNKETLEHLLGIVAANREQRCTELNQNAQLQVNKILHQAHTRVRTRVRRHISILREKYSAGISSAKARNQTLIRQRQQRVDKTCLDKSWPMLHDALEALWKNPETRYIWIIRAISNASSTLLQEHDWIIEYPGSFSDQEYALLQHAVAEGEGKTHKLVARDEIEAGIRITSQGTVIEATIEGLLQQRNRIEAILLARIRQDEPSHD